VPDIQIVARRNHFAGPSAMLKPERTRATGGNAVVCNSLDAEYHRGAGSGIALCQFHAG
jgi:hypothetical protein